MEINQDNYQEILNQLEHKASLKQAIYRSTTEIFGEAKVILSEIAKHLRKDYSLKDPSVEIAYRENNQFEVQLKFSGDMLVLSMHSNIFNFDPSNSIHQSDYIKKDPALSYCGIIYIHNFLADSIKYNRLSDVGYLIARILINKEKHFVVEGEGQLGFLYEDISNSLMNKTTLTHIIEQSILYCLDADLLMLPFAHEKEITLSQKQSMLANGGYPTGKHIGYLFKAELD